MFFRNLTFFRFPLAAAPAFAGDFGRQLADTALKPVGPLELSSRGWVSPAGQEDGDGRFAFWGERAVWLTLGGEDKILPGPVLAAALAKRLREIEEKEGRKPGGRTRKRIKEDLIHELLPKAFVKPSRLDGYLDLRRGLLVVDTASHKAADGFVSQLRHTLGSFPALPLNAEVAPRSVLTGWIAGEPLPEGLTLGNEAVLKDAADKGASVRMTRQELQGDETGKHLEAGKQATRLGLYLGEPELGADHLSFTLDEDLVLRKVKFLDGAAEKLENIERDDLEAELDARFALMVGEVGEVFDVLERALRLTKLED